MPIGDLRLDATRSVAMRLTAFVTYDALNCQKGCDLWAPQVGVLF